MAATLNLNRDPILILRIDGVDLLDFISGSEFETEMVSMISEMELSDTSLHDHIIQTLNKLTVDHGMPPSTDSWVMSNIVEPALQFCGNHEEPFSKHKFLEEFKKVAQTMAYLLKEHPVIVAHCENTFDGSAIHKLLCDKFELDKSLDAAMATVPKEQNGKMPIESMRAALDAVAISAGLPPYSGIKALQGMVEDAMKIMNDNGDDEKIFDEEDFKKMMSELLENMMLKLQTDPIVISSNTVVHESFASSSTALPPLSM